MPLFAVLGTFNIYSKRGSGHIWKVWDRKYFIMQMIFFPISYFTFHWSMMYSPSKIWETNNRAMQLGFGLQFIYVALMMQVSMVTLSKVNPFRRTIVFGWILLWINLYSMVYNNTVVFDEVHLIYLVIFVTTAAICHHIYNIFSEFKQILGVNMFTINPPSSIDRGDMLLNAIKFGKAKKNE